MFFNFIFENLLFYLTYPLLKTLTVENDFHILFINWPFLDYIFLITNNRIL